LKNWVKVIIFLLLPSCKRIILRFKMAENYKIRNGLNIRLMGRPEKVIEVAAQPESYALKPSSFPGLVAKLSVKAGDQVKAGQPLFFDKYCPEVVFVSPVGGIVSSVNRGERRKILEVVVTPDKNNEAIEFGKTDPGSMEETAIRQLLLKSGIWPFIKRRPYGIIAKPDEKPKSVFISCFDTAPLAPDYGLLLEGQQHYFQTGVDVLARLTTGKVYLGLSPEDSPGWLSSIKNAEKKYFSGPHPSGNVGIQIHHVDPINKGDIVWTINPQDLLFIGRLFVTGRPDFSKIVALTGSEVLHPRYFKSILGAKISAIIGDNLKKSHKKQRIISGNVFTGTKVNADSYLGFFDSQITVIPEGDNYEFLGWATPGVKKFSASKTFFSKLLPAKEYELNANMHGGERAFVMSGQYEKFLPMDILPVYLLKAILVNDIDKMEQLGINEVIEEDLALCEYACTSKIKIQDVLRQGINNMIKEFG
jgi:Na+-transporting NADH:ubiquinone oxidoreductase subunit A